MKYDELSKFRDYMISKFPAGQAPNIYLNNTTNGNCVVLSIVDDLAIKESLGAYKDFRLLMTFYDNRFKSTEELSDYIDSFERSFQFWGSTCYWWDGTSPKRAGINCYIITKLIVIARYAIRLMEDGRFQGELLFEGNMLNAYSPPFIRR